jgi:stage II sporulation protein D
VTAVNFIVAFVCTVSLPAADVSIGVFTLFRPTMLAIRSHQRAECHTPDGKVVNLERISGSAICTPAGEFTVEIPGRMSRRFRGALSTVRDGGAVIPVIRLDVETAVAATVAAEMPPGTPREALKALSVVVRSFYTAQTGRHDGYQFCDSTHCQFHRGPVAPGHPASLAAQATAGVITAYRGQPFAPLYSASCGGTTFRAVEIGMDAGPYPYFPVKCEHCARNEQSWTRELPAGIAALLATTRSEKQRLRVVRELGWSALPGNNYSAHRRQQSVVFNGRGSGHGVGLCQRGAIAMATRGASFREILRQYLPDVTLIESDQARLRSSVSVLPREGRLLRRPRPSHSSLPSIEVAAGDVEMEGINTLLSVNHYPND